MYSSYNSDLVKRAQEEGSTSRQFDHSQASHSGEVSCSTNQQCMLINVPKHGLKHVWSHSPDLHDTVKATQKARTNTSKPRKDLSRLLQTPTSIQEKKEKVIDMNRGNRKTYLGNWKSRRDYLRHQNREGKLTPSEEKDYQRTVKVQQEAYNKKRRDQRKAEKKEKKQSSDH